MIGLSSTAYAQGEVLHQVPLNVMAGEPLTLEALVEVTGSAVSTFSIFHRISGENNYNEVIMSAAGGGLWFGTISAGDVVAAGLEYYLVAEIEDGSLLAYPISDPQTNPVSIQVIAGGEGIFIDPLALFGQEEEESPILILSPTPRQFYLAEDVVIAVSLFNVENVDEESIRLLLDGEDVTSRADVSADLVTYMPSKIDRGAHQVELQVSDLSGAAQVPAAWRFLVAAKASLTSERAYRHSGKVTAAYRSDNIDEQVLNVSDVKLSYRGGWDWLKLRSNLKLTSQEDVFKPPRNRYSASFTTGIFTLGLGDVTPRINRFALDGKRVRGYDADLRLKYVNLRIVKGELERAIDGRNESAYRVSEYTFENPEITGDVDTLKLNRTGYNFHRNLLAVRPSFGSGQNFELAFIYVKAKDDKWSVERDLDDGEITIDNAEFGNYFQDMDTTSWDTRIVTLDRIRQEANTNAGFTYELPDSNWAGKAPKDNLVIGSDLTLAFNKRRFVVQSGFAMSMLNNNIWDPVFTKDNLDTLAIMGDSTLDGQLTPAGVDIPIDPAEYERYFHMNINQIPLLPIDPVGLDTNLVGAILNMPSMAYHASMKLNYLRNFITLEFQQVGPEFNSLANPNIQKNVKVKSISDRLRLFRNKLMLSVKRRTTSDDIIKQPGESITSTETTNLSANINLGRGLPSFSIGSRSYTRENGIDTVSTALRIDGTDTTETFIDKRSSTTTKSLNLSFMYQLELLGSRHDLSLNISSNEITDDITDRVTDDTLYTIPRSPRATSNVTAIGINSRINEQLRSSVSLSTNASEFGEGEDVMEDSVVVTPGMIAQDLFTLNVMLVYRIPALKLKTRGGFVFLSSKSDRSNSTQAPPNFTRLGIKGGLEYDITDDLQFITAFEFRTKTIELEDGGSESIPSSIISANLQYKF